MKTLPRLVMAGGLLLACGSASRALGQVGNFTAPLGQPSFSNYGAPYGQLGQPTPNQYMAPYGQLGQPTMAGQMLPGYPSNFVRPSFSPTPFGQPTYAQSYFGIPNYAQPAIGPPSVARFLGAPSDVSAFSRAYTPMAPLGQITNYAQTVRPPSSGTRAGVLGSDRSPLIPH